MRAASIEPNVGTADEGVQEMGRVLLLIAFGGAVSLYAQQIAETKPAADLVAGSGASVRGANPSSNLPSLPAPPRGKSTVFGGEIRAVDPVRDQMTLRVFGEKPMKILFDERTQVFRDGKRIPLHDLGPSEHASVQTALDGAKVFAVSVHILTQSPQGNYQGRVLSYHPDTRELVIDSGDAGVPLRLLVASDASVVREGQSAFTSNGAGIADLTQGALISVDFAADKNGHGTADRIAVLATPGSAFVFSGDISALDLHSGSLVLVDPRDGKDYQIFLESAHTPTIPDLHVGERVRVSAEYNGTHYVANEISTN